LECARSCEIKRFVHVSTDEVYGDVVGEGVDESGALDPTNPYSCSKAAAEFIARAYMKSYGLPVVITRGNNVYGPHQYPEKVVPKFILRLLDGQTCCLHGDGETSRSYVHVLDVVDAFDKILHNGVVCEVYNIGSKSEITIKALATKLILELGLRVPEKAHELLEFVEDRNINDRRYAVDDSKLRALGWKQKVDWDQGLRDTVAWYKKLPDSHWKDHRKSLAPHPTA